MSRYQSAERKEAVVQESKGQDLLNNDVSFRCCDYFVQFKGGRAHENSTLHQYSSNMRALYSGLITGAI